MLHRSRLFCLAAWVLSCANATEERARPPWSTEVYVWQRRVGPEVLESMRRVAPYVRGFNVLAAEVDATASPPRTTFIELAPYAQRDATRAPSGASHAQRTIALSVRMTALRGALRDHGPALSALALALEHARRRAEALGLRVGELQVDFDATRAQVGDYTTWMYALKAALPEHSLTFTALPDWLRSPHFAALAYAADGYVLQVHALPSRAGPRTLCDPRAARRAAARAQTYGAPFRVALPSYGYGVARDPKGRLLGVVAEGHAPRWPAGTRIDELRAQPGEMVSLARSLADAGHTALTGIIWYRLPVAGDVRAWPLPTFLAVLEGRVARAKLSVSTRVRSFGLIDLEIVNDGDAPAAAPRAVRIHGDVLVADGLAGYHVRREGTSAIVFASDPSKRGDVAPGTRRTIGWYRWPEGASPPPTYTVEE